MKLTILPDNVVLDVEKGVSLLEAVRKAGINLASSCGGAGTCGKCKVEPVSGNLDSKARTKKLGANEVLACQSFMQDGDVTINIPHDGRRLSSHKVLINEVPLQILIAGGFGNSLNIKDAIAIGMLPDVPLEKYRYVGNSSLKGAQMSLTSTTALEEVKEMARGMTYLDLSVGNDFMDEFVSALFLPHTDFTQFKSVANL